MIMNVTFDGLKIKILWFGILVRGWRVSENRVEIRGGTECRVVSNNQLLQWLPRRGGFGDFDVE